MMTATSHRRCVYNKDFLLRRKEAYVSQSWPKNLSKQHINGVGLWDPVSYSKQLSKEEKLKRTKRQPGMISNVFQRKRTREARDSYSQNSWMINSYNGFPSRNNQGVYYVQDEYDVYYEPYGDYGQMYDYGAVDDDYNYMGVQNGRKRPVRPRRQIRNGRIEYVNGNLSATNEISEPEWYTSGPTSHIETINLEGLPCRNNAYSQKRQVPSNEIRQSMDVHSSTTAVNSDKENDQNGVTRENNVQRSQADQTRDTAGKQLLQLIQNGSQKNASEFPPSLPAEVKDATTSAELEMALKGLLFKDKESNSMHKSDDLLAKLKAKSQFPRHLRVGFYKKCMLNGQVKTVAELEGHTDESEKNGLQKDVNKSHSCSETSTKGNVLSNSDSSDQSAFYRLLGMIKANANLDELPNAKLRISSIPKSSSNPPDLVDSCKVATPATEPSSTKLQDPPQGRNGTGDGDNTNNNSIKDSSNVIAAAVTSAVTNSTSAVGTATATTTASTAAASSSTTVTPGVRTSTTNRLQIPLSQAGILRGAPNPVAAAAAAAAAGINPILTQSHPHVQSHLLSSHMQPHLLSAAAHQLFNQHSQQQPQTMTPQQQQQQQLAALAARYASGGVSASPYIPPQWLYLAVAQQHAQVQQQQSYQQVQQPPSHPQHGVSLPSNIVGKAATAAAAIHQANSSQQVYRWFRAWSNATAAKVCIKQSNATQPPITKQNLSSDDENIEDLRVNAALHDVKKTRSEPDICNPPAVEDKAIHLSTHSTPCRGSLRHDNVCNAERKREAVMSDTETEVNSSRKEEFRIDGQACRTNMQSKSTQSDYSPLRSTHGGSSGFTLVPPQRIAPPMQSSMSAVNSLFRLPPGYTPNLPSSLRLHQTNANNSESGAEGNGGLGKWFSSEVTGNHRLVGIPQISSIQDMADRASSVEDLEKC